MAEARYHVRFKDEASGDELGLMLVELPQLGYNRRLINPYAAKGAQGQTQDSDLTEWSVVSFRDWRGGRGQEEMEDRTWFYDAWNVESRIEGQLTLGPLPKNPTGTLPRYEPGDVDPVAFGYPRGPRQESYETTGASINSSQKRGQRVRFRDLTYSFDEYLASVDVRVWKTGGPTQALRVSLYSDSDGYPDSELIYKEVAAASIPTSADWVNFEFALPYQLTDTDGYYWIVLSTAESSGIYWWSAETRGAYPDGYTAVGNGSWTIYPGSAIDYTFRCYYAAIAVGMSFDAPAGGITCDEVYLYMRFVELGSTVTVKLCQNSGGSPGTVMTTKTVSVGQSVYSWVEVVWDSGQALTGSTTYWITVEHASEQEGHLQFCEWGGDADAGYSGGAAKRKLGSGSWSAISYDQYFRINIETGDVLDGAAVKFARFGGKWYVGAGDTVYEWDEAGLDWDVSDEVSGDNVTDLEVWGGYLWAARGADAYLRKYNGTSWADDGTNYAQLLKGGGGYLHRTDPTNVHYLYYTADGSTWSDAIVVGVEDFAITALEWFRDQLVVATSVRLWGIAAETAYPLLDWSSQEDADNARRMLYWSRTGCLYIPLMYGLYRWNGDTMVAVGPEQGTGLPAERAGKIAALVGTGNWLFAAVDANTTGQSSILAYRGMSGWHELQRAEQTGQRVRALGFETISSPSRLWFGLGSGTRYLQLPDYTDNPYQWSGYEFNATGELITSWMGGELLEVIKDLHEVVVRGEDLSSDQMVEVYYEVDRSGRWTYLGELTEAPRDSLSFGTSTFLTKTVGSSSTRTTIELASGSVTTDMVAGDWVRINGEVAQVASVTDSDTFVLETALSEAPESGDTVYAAGPAGREFRIKLVLSTTDNTSTPKIKAVFLRYQNNVLDRFMYSLSIRVEDGLADLVGNPYPHTAADLRVALDEWAKREKSFSLYDPDGVARTVKVTSVGEGGFSRIQKEGQAARYGSVYSMNLVEVA